MSRTSRRCWSKSIGERGHRVRLYEARPGGPIMRSVFVSGREDRKSLRTSDKGLAIREAYQLLNALLANEQALKEQSLTLGKLADLYLESPTHQSKKERTQRDEGAMLRRVVAFLGPTRNVHSVSESDVRRYAFARRQGTGAIDRTRSGTRVRDRTIEADLEMLRRALNWATRERTRTGQRLLQENPLLGVKLPAELNPRRPVLTHDVFQRLLKVARRVHPLLRLGLIVAEGTGRRLSAWRNLRWGDVAFEQGTIRWRAETDKQGREQVVPMSKGVHAALVEARRGQRAIGNTPVFPAPENASQPCSRYLLDRWLRKAFSLAGVPRDDAMLWHAIRRKWATERKGYPVKDVMHAGGWHDEATLLACYQQADPGTIRRVVLHPTHRLVSSGTHNGTHNGG
jgi:integrase